MILFPRCYGLSAALQLEEHGINTILVDDKDVLGKDTDITETGMEMIDLILKELRNQ